MTNIISTQQTAVSTLSNDIHVITAEINAYQRVAGEAIFEIGKRLKHVKENDLARGEWSKWCESIGMQSRHANKFIVIYDQLRDKWSTSTTIGFEPLYQIATMPEEQRDRPHTIPSTGETKTVDEMTVRELREVKKALREAEQRTELAETARRQAEERAAEAKHSEEIAMRQLERAEEQLATATKPKEIIVEKPVEKVVTIDKTNYKAVERLKAYEERFGALENYTDRIRGTNLADVTTSVMTFSKAVRELVKRHAYLVQYQDSISALDSITRRQYDETIEALRGFTDLFSPRNSKYSEIVDAVIIEQ